MMPKTIQTMAWAYQQICAGEDPWTALGNFTNAWYDYAKDIRAALVSEPMGKPKAGPGYRAYPPLGSLLRCLCRVPVRPLWGTLSAMGV